MAYRDRLLAFLEAYWETRGYGPTLEEIRRHVGFSSRSHALYHLRALIGEGRVQQEPGKHRTWRPTSRPALRISVPLKGVIPASHPDQVDEVVPQELGDLWLPAAWVPARCWFALWVRGDSMIGLGIRPFDIVLVEPVSPEEVRSGDLVVARVKGRNQMTLKQLVQDPETRTWWLRPAHPELAPARMDWQAWTLEGRVAFRFGPVRDLGSITTA
jgi:repressor LexA